MIAALKSDTDRSLQQVQRDRHCCVRKVQTRSVLQSRSSRESQSDHITEGDKNNQGHKVGKGVGLPASYLERVLDFVFTTAQKERTEIFAGSFVFHGGGLDPMDGEREVERETERKRNRQTDRQTDRMSGLRICLDFTLCLKW